MAGSFIEATAILPDSGTSTGEAGTRGTGGTPSQASIAENIESLTVKDDSEGERAKGNEGDPVRASRGFAESQPGTDTPKTVTKERKTGPSSGEFRKETVDSLPVNNDSDTRNPNESAADADVKDSEDDATPSNGMNEINATSRRPKLSPPRTLEMTLFDRLEKMYGAGIKRLLAVQYR